MTERPAVVHWREMALLALLALLQGASFSFIKIAVESIPPLTLVMLRASIALPVLWAVVLWRRDRIPTDCSTWGHFFIQAWTASIAPITLIIWGQQFVDTSLASVINSTTPLFVFIITALWTRHEAVTGRRLLGVVIGLGGAALIIGIDALGGLGQHIAGQLAMMGASVFYALSAIFSRRFRGIPTAVTGAATITWSIIVIVPVAFMVEDPLSATPTTASLAAALSLGLLSTAGTTLIYYRLTDTLGSMGAASAGYMRAGFSVAIGIFLLGEPFTWTLAVGLTAVLAGVAAINSRR